jgi:hypothetical protein
MLSINMLNQNRGAATNWLTKSRIKILTMVWMQDKYHPYLLKIHNDTNYKLEDWKSLLWAVNNFDLIKLGLVFSYEQHHPFWSTCTSGNFKTKEDVTFYWKKISNLFFLNG